MTPSRGGLLAKTDKGHYTVYNRAAKLPEGGFVKSFAGGYNVAKGVGRMLRQAGGVEYELTYKKVKNLNLRLAADGHVAVSAPRRTPVAEIDAFVASRAGWIDRARARRKPLPEPPDDEVCRAVFAPWLEKYAPLFGGMPQVRLKTLRSMWGCCRPAKREITLNRRLAAAPAAAVEYVILHEYLHLIYPDHGPAFHAALDAMMPDNRARRALLRGGADWKNPDSVVE